MVAGLGSYKQVACFEDVDGGARCHSVEELDSH